MVRLPAGGLPPAGGDLGLGPGVSLPSPRRENARADPGGPTVSEHDCGVWSVWRCASVRKIKAQQHSGVRAAAAAAAAAERKRAERPAGCSLLCANERRQFESHENCSCFPAFEQKTLD